MAGEKEIELMQQIRKITKQKAFQRLNAFISVKSIWCSIKDDYRTLIELEGVSVVNQYDEIIDDTPIE
ncbi:MAG TPA: hypothetical protein VLF59_05145 [Candidatus Saccharimonadales bacterium]|nr:hypothetical protein [Candidatus Saccharimonadales bacterium]